MLLKYSTQIQNDTDEVPIRLTGFYIRLGNDVSGRRLGESKSLKTFFSNTNLPI